MNALGRNAYEQNIRRLMSYMIWNLHSEEQIKEKVVGDFNGYEYTQCRCEEKNDKVKKEKETGRVEKEKKEEAGMEKKKNKKKIERLEKELLHHHNQKEKETGRVEKEKKEEAGMEKKKNKKKIVRLEKELLHHHNQKEKENGREEKEKMKEDEKEKQEKEKIRTGQPLNGTFIEQEIVDHLNNGTPPWDRENHSIPRQRKCDSVMVVHHNNPKMPIQVFGLKWEEFLKDRKEREEEYHKKNERSQEEEQAKKTTDPNRQKEQEEIIARLNIEIKRLGFRIEILHERVVKCFRNKRKEIKRLQKELRREDKINARLNPPLS
ncbi:uncharacterized protein [Palaemon carinicauda]|uniref:uncharacterized protein n=1 Tax=Palaemon carinicauda TaxID=392227 RepID=UPI0035B57B1F